MGGQVTLSTHGLNLPHHVPNMTALHRGCVRLVHVRWPTHTRRFSPQGSRSCSQQALLIKSGEQKRTRHLTQAGWMCSDLSIRGLDSRGCSCLWLPLERNPYGSKHTEPWRESPQNRLADDSLTLKMPALVSLQVKPLVCLLRFHETFSGWHCHFFSVIHLAVQPRGTVWIQRWKFLANRLVSESRTCCEIPEQDWKRVFQGTVRLVAWHKQSSGIEAATSKAVPIEPGGGSKEACAPVWVAPWQVWRLFFLSPTPARTYSSSVPCGAS